MKRKQMYTQLIHVRVPHRLRTKAIQAAHQQDCTLSDWVRQQIKAAVPGYAGDTGKVPVND